MSSATRLSMDELNAAALERFVYMPVNRTMVTYLAQAACDVIQCDPTMMPTQNQSQYATPPRTPSPHAAGAGSCANDDGLPTLEAFITQLVVSSNVQVPTLMSTLVYLTRLKSRLQPMAKGLRCTTHRIFLATLILAAKYLNDSSPKNKHWASYSHVNKASSSHSSHSRGSGSSFGFSRTEVNLMEKQLLFLLDWELRITEADLYAELDPFLAPIRDELEAKHARHLQRRRQREAEAKLYAAAAQYPAHQEQQPQPQSQQYPTPPASRASSRTRHHHPSPPTETIRMVHHRDDDEVSTPPELTYSRGSSVGSMSDGASSYASSYASSSSSTSSSRQHSRSSTPLSSDPEDAADPYVAATAAATSCYGSSSLYESPVEIVIEMPAPYHGHGGHGGRKHGQQRLPYEVGPDELAALQQDGSSHAAKRPRTHRGVWGRLLGGHA
ncbi:hypothetical protein GGR56DRAFT_636472 [Xylariaceae sp. FL0804]|nr:hypothetical protein GGR56DRAFT_636472 [Xylariaceae sp. FL0804]